MFMQNDRLVSMASAPSLLCEKDMAVYAQATRISGLTVYAYDHRLIVQQPEDYANRSDRLREICAKALVAGNIGTNLPKQRLEVARECSNVNEKVSNLSVTTGNTKRKKKSKRPDKPRPSVVFSRGMTIQVEYRQKNRKLAA